MESIYKLPRQPIEPPEGVKKLLLHSCCAPCAGEMMEAMVEAGVELTVFFYNPNIHPQKEYLIRKQENIRYCEKANIPFVDADYDVENWFQRVKGMEFDPERGQRCSTCFDMRFERTALYAIENGFTYYTSSLGISRWKDFDQINRSGHTAANRYEGLKYWDYNWRKNGGSSRMYEIAKREEFYQQQYCGCIFSLRDTNKHRISSGRSKIEIGETWYANKIEEPKA